MKVCCREVHVLPLRVNSSSSRLAISGGAAADPLTGGASPKVGGNGTREVVPELKGMASFRDRVTTWGTLLDQIRGTSNGMTEQNKAFQWLESIIVGKGVPRGLWETRLSLGHVLRSFLAHFIHLQ